MTTPRKPAAIVVHITRPGRYRITPGDPPRVRRLGPARGQLQLDRIRDSAIRFAASWRADGVSREQCLVDLEEFFLDDPGYRDCEADLHPSDLALGRRLLARIIRDVYRGA